MKMKGFVNLQEREGKDARLSDACKLREPAVYTLKVTDRHCTHPLTCRSPAPWEAGGSSSLSFLIIPLLPLF